MKKILILTVGIALSMFTTSSTYQKPDITIDEVRKNIIALMSSARRQDAYDVNLKLKSLNYFGEEEDRYLKNACNMPSAHLYYQLVIAFDTKNLFWNHYAFFNKEYPLMQQNFKELFGQDALAQLVPMAQKTPDEKDFQKFRFFNGKGLKAAFDKLYKKPQEKFENICTYQKVYDIALKGVFASATSLIIDVMKNKKDFEACAKEYLEKAKKDPNFDGQVFTNQCTQKLLGEKEYECGQANRIVGMLLRRQCDGTLPVVLSCLKQIVKDYDNDTFKKIGKNF
jgi:hypothetical protein